MILTFVTFLTLAIKFGRKLCWSQKSYFYKLFDFDLVEVLGAQYIGVIGSLFLPGKQFI